MASVVVVGVVEEEAEVAAEVPQGEEVGEEVAVRRIVSFSASRTENSVGGGFGGGGFGGRGGVAKRGGPGGGPSGPGGPGGPGGGHGPPGPPGPHGPAMPFPPGPNDFLRHSSYQVAQPFFGGFGDRFEENEWEGWEEWLLEWANEN